jgi:hypothetical protein
LIISVLISSFGCATDRLTFQILQMSYSCKLNTKVKYSIKYYDHNYLYEYYVKIYNTQDIIPHAIKAINDHITPIVFENYIRHHLKVGGFLKTDEKMLICILREYVPNDVATLLADFVLPINLTNHIRNEQMKIINNKTFSNYISSSSDEDNLDECEFSHDKEQNLEKIEENSPIMRELKMQCLIKETDRCLINYVKSSYHGSICRQINISYLFGLEGQEKENSIILGLSNVSKRSMIFGNEIKIEHSKNKSYFLHDVTDDNIILCNVGFYEYVHTFCSYRFIIYLDFINSHLYICQ